ncbi:MAG: hypothetical protein CSA39_06645 [Flavobacteriales bacterium]|nr:MAG: hypothetical protein CR985_01530 [Flavobacteriales bacterium]PIE48654.1 MAG: hypothetical protein CSA39_06645 [Flavobacteriales bacterium]
MFYLYANFTKIIRNILYLPTAFKMLNKLEDEDFYFNEKGYRVFTEKYHLKRGYCCQSGCLHCPYGYDKKTHSFRNNTSR